jgi:ATP-dependent Clp protease ATP-binding subunit ClpB
LKAAEESLAKANGSTMVHSEVTEEHIAQVVSKWTGIPVARLVAGQRERL